MLKNTALIMACAGLICLTAITDAAVAQGIKYGQANQQDMLRRSRELNQRAKQDTLSATDRMRKVLQEKRDGQRGLDKDFMMRQGSANSAGRQQ